MISAWAATRPPVQSGTGALIRFHRAGGRARDIPQSRVPACYRLNTRDMRFRTMVSTMLTTRQVTTGKWNDVFFAR